MAGFCHGAGGAGDVSRATCLCVALLVRRASQCADLELCRGPCLWHAAGDTDSAALYDLLRELVQTYEAPFPNPLAFELPDDYVQSMMQGIVGFTIRLTRLEGKFKLSQNRSLADRHRVAVALQAQGDSLSTAVATLMEQRLEMTP